MKTNAFTIAFLVALLTTPATLSAGEGLKAEEVAFQKLIEEPTKYDGRFVKLPVKMTYTRDYSAFTQLDVENQTTCIKFALKQTKYADGTRFNMKDWRSERVMVVGKFYVASPSNLDKMVLTSGCHSKMRILQPVLTELDK